MVPFSLPDFRIDFMPSIAALAALFYVLVLAAANAANSPHIANNIAIWSCDEIRFYIPLGDCVCPTDSKTVVCAHHPKYLPGKCVRPGISIKVTWPMQKEEPAAPSSLTLPIVIDVALMCRCRNAHGTLVAPARPSLFDGRSYSYLVTSPIGEIQSNGFNSTFPSSLNSCSSSSSSSSCDVEEEEAWLELLSPLPGVHAREKFLFIKVRGHNILPSDQVMLEDLSWPNDAPITFPYPINGEIQLLLEDQTIGTSMYRLTVLRRQDTTTTRSESGSSSLAAAIAAGPPLTVFIEYIWGEEAFLKAQSYFTSAAYLYLSNNNMSVVDDKTIDTAADAPAAARRSNRGGEGQQKQQQQEGQSRTTTLSRDEEQSSQTLSSSTAAASIIDEGKYPGRLVDDVGDLVAAAEYVVSSSSSLFSDKQQQQQQQQHSIDKEQQHSEEKNKGNDNDDSGLLSHSKFSAGLQQDSCRWNDWIVPAAHDVRTHERTNERPLPAARTHEGGSTHGGNKAASGHMRVAFVAGGGFDGQKQIMAEQWRSLASVPDIDFAMVWVCTDTTAASTSTSADNNNHNNVAECPLDPQMEKLLRDSPHVKLAFWPQLTLSTGRDVISQRPDDGRATLVEYCRWAAANAADSINNNNNDNNDNPGSMRRTTPHIDIPIPFGGSSINDTTSSSIIPDPGGIITASCAYEYLVLRLRAVGRDIHRVSPPWVKEVWGHWRDIIEPLNVDIVVLGNNGGASDLIVPETALSLGARAVVLDLAATVDKPHPLMEFHAVVAPSRFASCSFPYETIDTTSTVAISNDATTTTTVQHTGTSTATTQSVSYELLGEIEKRKGRVLKRFIVSPGVDVRAFERTSLTQRHCPPQCEHAIGGRKARAATATAETPNHDYQNQYLSSPWDVAGNKCNEACYVVGFVGRLVAAKSPGMFLLAAQHILKEIPSTVFLVVGSGPLLEPLKELSIRLGIQDHVHFAGSARQPEIASLYVAMDVFVMPSLMPSETFGIVNIEAMLMGLPIVSFGTFGQGEYLSAHWGVASNSSAPLCKNASSATPVIVRPPKNAVIVTECSSEAVAEAVVMLLRNATLRHEIGTAARDTVLDKYTSQHSGYGYYDVYKDLMRI